MNNDTFEKCPSINSLKEMKNENLDMHEISDKTDEKSDDFYKSDYGQEIKNILDWNILNF